MAAWKAGPSGPGCLGCSLQPPPAAPASELCRLIAASEGLQRCESHLIEKEITIEIADENPDAVMVLVPQSRQR